MTIGSDGTFTYKPDAGFTGTDSFTYRITDPGSLGANGTVTITVTASPPASGTFYFQSGAPSDDVWALAGTLPAASPPSTDLDGDGDPGLTIAHSNGSADNQPSKKIQSWTYTAPAPLVLAGPVKLDLWSAAGSFTTGGKLVLYSYLYDCAAGGSSCTLIASSTDLNNPWNTASGTWGNRLITVGSVSRTILAGHELTLRLTCNLNDFWVTMTQAYPSALIVTLG